MKILSVLRGVAMELKIKQVTKYLRSAIAAQTNMGIDFKADTFYSLSLSEILDGKVDQMVCSKIFEEANKKSSESENVPTTKSSINIIICAKTIKTIFEANERTHNELEELTGVFYIPAVIDSKGLLHFEKDKLPWFPREYLMPMVEPILALGDAEVVDSYISSHVDKIESIRTWAEFVTFLGPSMRK